MNLAFTTRLSSGQTQTQLNATVLASLEEIIAAIDSGSKPDRVNFHQFSRFYGGQFATNINGNRLGLYADGFGVPLTAYVNKAVDDTSRATASLGDRVFVTQYGLRGTRGMIGGETKMGILRGLGTVTIADLASTGTLTVNWDSGTPPTVAEQKPAGWGTPLADKNVIIIPQNGGSQWFSSPRVASHYLTAVTDTGFTIGVRHDSWAAGGPSTPFATGVRTFLFNWFATFAFV